MAWHPESLAQAILTLLQGPDQLKRWGLQAKKQLQPTYLQQHCLDQLEQLSANSRHLTSENQNNCKSK